MVHRVVLAATSYNKPFYADGNKTGVYFVELSHPYAEFRKAGFEVTIVTEDGTIPGFDEHSLAADALGEEDAKVFNDHNSSFMQAVKNTKSIHDLDPKDYDVFFASAGHGTMFDYPTASKLQSFASKLWAKGGIVGAVCHGPVLLPKVIDPLTGQSVLKGRTVTGFPWKGEEILKVDKHMTDLGLDSVEKQVKDAGANWLEPEPPFGDVSVADGRLVTGANPASAVSTAQKMIALVK